MNLKIVKMEITYLTEIKEKLKDFDEFWNGDILDNEFNNGNSKYFVVLDDNKVLAFGGLWFNIDEAHVMNIAVNKNFRRKGIGTKLLGYLIEVAKSKAKKCITLEVKEDNISAIKLYEKMNFTEVGRRKKYYDNLFDAVIMTRTF